MARQVVNYCHYNAGIILAGAYAFTAKEQWTSQAQVRVSEPAQRAIFKN